MGRQDVVFYDNRKIFKMVPFHPIYILGEPGFQHLEKLIKAKPLPEGLKIHLDYERKLAFFGHGANDLVHLAMVLYPPLFEIIGTPSRTVFDGYNPKYKVDWHNKNSQFKLVSAINPYHESSLLAQAQMDFAKKEPANPHLRTLSKNSSHKEIVHQILSDFPGLIIGESHSNITPKKFMLEQMENFIDEGVDALFLEHLQFDSIQEDLDAFMESDSEKIPAALEAILTKPEMHPHDDYCYQEISLKAKNAGIRRIVAIDTNVSYELGFDKCSGSKGAHRFFGMNYTNSEK